MRRNTLVAGVAVAGLLAAGCGHRSSTVREKMAEAMVHAASGGKATIDAHGQEIRVKAEDGSEVRSSWGGKVPANFPKDVPVYAGATVVASVTSPQGMNLTLKTADSVDKVAAFYEEGLAAGGWTQESTANVQGNAMLSYKKGGRTVTAVINDGGEERMIALGVSGSETDE